MDMHDEAGGPAAASVAKNGHHVYYIKRVASKSMSIDNFVVMCKCISLEISQRSSKFYRL